MPNDPNPHLPGTQPLASKALSVPPEMIFEIATGMETPVVIAERYGYSEAEYAALLEWKPFVQILDRQRAELERTGYTFLNEVRWIARDKLRDLYKRSKGPDLTFLQELEFFTRCAKLADYEPKASMPVAQGTGFSININFSNRPKPLPPIEGTIIDSATPPVDATLLATPSADSPPHHPPAAGEIPVPQPELPLAASNPFVADTGRRKKAA